MNMTCAEIEYASKNFVSLNTKPEKNGGNEMQIEACVIHTRSQRQAQILQAATLLYDNFIFNFGLYYPSENLPVWKRRAWNMVMVKVVLDVGSALRIMGGVFSALRQR